MKNYNVDKVACRAYETLQTESLRIVRVIGAAGTRFTPMLKKVLTYPVVENSSICIEDIFFDSDHGFLGWVSNALGLYEGVIAARGRVPPHLPEFVRLMGVKYLIFENFHDAFYVRGVSSAAIAKDINSLLSACPNLRILVAQTIHHSDFAFTSLLEHPWYDIPI